MNKVLLTLLTGSFLASPLLARPLAQKGGWEFSVSINAGYTSSQSNISTGDDKAIITDLNSKAESDNNVIGYPFARVQYTTEDLKTQYFLGNSRDQISISQFQYEVGLTHHFADNSKLTIAYFPELPIFNETWQDPYLTGQARSETDEDSQGGRIELSRVAGGPFTLKYAYAQSDVQKDTAGESWSENGRGLSTQDLLHLQRSSQYHRVALETILPIYSGTFLQPTLQYTSRNADGDANSYDDYTVQLGLLFFKGRHTSITTLSAGTSQYKQRNAIFNMKRDSINTGIFSVYRYAEAFNWKPLAFTLIAGYNQKVSDITFYNERGLIVSTGLVYTF